MTTYAQHVSRRATPQSEQAEAKQVENSAGGFSFALDKWSRLNRFLILGAEGGSYYASERKLTKENANCIQDCLEEDGIRTVAEIVGISDSGRAPKNDPAIFALALAAAHDNVEVRREALKNLSAVCRIGTHLFQFVAAVREFRGGGRALRKAIAAWYISRPADNLAYQVVKYRQRKIGDETWSHRDIIRTYGRNQFRAVPSAAHEAVIRYVVRGAGDMGSREVKRKVGPGGNYQAVSEAPAILEGFDQLQSATAASDVIALIREHGLTHEMVPSEFKNDVAVWGALLEKMPMGAMVRNLAKMSAVGLLAPLSDASKFVAARLADEEAIRKSRMHPLALLSAMKVYASGRGVRGSLTWTPVPQVIDGIEEGYYLAFPNIEPTGKNLLLALDVSSSMMSPNIAGLPGISPRIGSVAMAMATARTEANYQFLAFTSKSGGPWARGAALTPLDISKRDRLDTAIQKVSGLSFGGTDCALPMIWALDNKIKVDTFCVYTDSETWAGNIHPHQALKKYRRAINPDAKLIVVGMTSNGFTIADPSDAGMLDVVGFDTAAPGIMADFTRGNL